MPCNRGCCDIIFTGDILDMRVILASGSPRRSEILRELGFDFEIHKPEVDETKLEGESPENLCLRLSRLKAETVAKDFANELVIAADTIVVINCEILGKPKDKSDAFRMLSELQGREHEVMTALTICKSGKIISCVEHSFVKFRSLTEREILAYISTGESDDKAGAYAVQGKGAFLIEQVRGDFYNVVGLPIFRLGKILGEFGYDFSSCVTGGNF